jgi:deoxyribodipyrimidine photo-lyase
MVKQQIRIFIFRRDLRLFDNTALLDACNFGSAGVTLPVLPLFIFNPNQIDKTKNSYYNAKSIRFMLECLEELEGNIAELGGKLLFFENENDANVLEMISKQFEIKSIHSNKDVTPFAERRDGIIRSWALKKIAVDFVHLEDYTFHSLDEVRTKTVTPTGLKNEGIVLSSLYSFQKHMSI